MRAIKKGRKIVFKEISPIEMKKKINSLETENIKLKKMLVMLLDLSSFYMEAGKERQEHYHDSNITEMI